jgi:hypothetical protein
MAYLATGFVAAVAAVGFLPSPIWWGSVFGAAVVGFALGKRGALAWGVSLGFLAVATLPEGPVLEGPVAIEGRVVSAASCGAADVMAHRFAPAGAEWSTTRGRVRVDF